MQNIIEAIGDNGFGENDSNEKPAEYEEIKEPEYEVE